MHFVICIIRVFVCRAICNVLVGWRTGEPIVTLPHIMHCVFKVKAAEMELLVEWLLGGPVNQLCFHTRTLLCQQHSRNHFEKGFFNILVLIKRDALLAAAGVLNTSQMELNRWKVKGV